MSESQKKPAEIFLDLRNQMLKQNPAEIGINEFFGKNNVWAVLMETGYPEGTASLVAVSDGNASLYLSHGGGTIGAGQHDAVKQISKNLVMQADGYIQFCQETKDFPLPRVGQTIFYILTKDKFYMSASLEENFGEDRHQLSPLFYIAQDLIAQIRFTEEGNKN